MDNIALIVGLGNPGMQYEGTRHNFGFLALEAFMDFVRKSGNANRISKQSDPFLLWKVPLPGAGSVLLTEPLTFMNRSGEAVQRIASYYNLEAEQILVLHDELDLPLGRMKLKIGGGSAGHNGLKSLQQMLGTPNFYRLRLGIGKPERGEVYSYVLSRFRAEELSEKDEVLAAAVRGMELFLSRGLREAQEFCNGFLSAAMKHKEEEKAAARKKQRAEQEQAVNTEKEPNTSTNMR